MEALLSAVLTIIVLLAATFTGFVTSHIIVGRKLDDTVNPSEKMTKAQVEHHNNMKTVIIMIAAFIGAITVSQPLFIKVIFIIIPIVYLSFLVLGSKLNEGFMKGGAIGYTLIYVAWMIGIFTLGGFSFIYLASNIALIICFSQYKLGSGITSIAPENEE